MTLTNIKDKHFIDRKKASDAHTYALTQLLERHNHWKIQRYATSEEDQKELVDLYVEYPDKEGIFPIQFKVRTDPKYQDFIVSRYQPCYGLDQEIVDEYNLGKTCNGRDWRGLVNKKSSYYYIATMNSGGLFSEISFCISNNLRKRVVELDQFWETKEERNKFKYTAKAINTLIDKKIYKKKILKHDLNNDEIWYQKNYGERPKFLMYISNDVRDDYFKITSDMQSELNELIEEFKTS